MWSMRLSSSSLKAMTLPAYASDDSWRHRPSVLGLRWDDIDLGAGRLSVRRALIPSGREVVVSEPKTARGRRHRSPSIPRPSPCSRPKPPVGSPSRASLAERLDRLRLRLYRENGEALDPENVTHATGARP